MAYNIAINGCGRIGICVLRAYYQSNYKSQLNLVAINEIAGIEKLSYLIKYDSSFGPFDGSIKHDGKNLLVNGDVISIFSENNVALLPWHELGIDAVLDCSGCYRTKSSLGVHLEKGAKKVILSCPGDDDLDATIIYGINEHTLASKHTIISNASCTANCAVPVLKIIDDALSIEYGCLTTLHAIMHDQPVVDSYHHLYDLRRMRSSVQSIVPVATELAQGVAQILPQLSGRLQSSSLRVPITNVSGIDMTVTVKKSVDEKSVNNLLLEASNGSLRGILGVTEDPVVSCDFKQDRRSAIIDVSQTRVCGTRMIRILAWFDNEWGYANRMLDTTLALLRS